MEKDNKNKRENLQMGKNGEVQQITKHLDFS